MGARNRNFGSVLKSGSMVRNHEGSGNAPMIVCDYTAARHSFTGRPAIEPTKTNREKSCQRHQAPGFHLGAAGL